MSEDGFTLELMTESFCSLHGTSLMSEYAAFLQNFLDSENADQHTLKEIQALMLEHDLEPSFEENLAANVENYEKQLQLIKGKSDNLTIQLTAKKEANKVDAAEKKSLIERFYAVECEKANKDLQKSSEKWDKIELELKENNVLAIAKKNIQLNEMKNNLQMLLSEKSAAMSRANEEAKALRVLLDEMRAQYIQLQNKQRFGLKNYMHFDVFPVQTNGNHFKEKDISLNRIASHQTPRHKILTKAQYSGKLHNMLVYKQSMLKPNPCNFLLKHGIMSDKFSLPPVIASYSGQSSLSKVMKIDESTIIEMATIQQKNLSDNGCGRPRKLPTIYRAKNLK